MRQAQEHKQQKQDYLATSGSSSLTWITHHTGKGKVVSKITTRDDDRGF